METSFKTYRSMLRAEEMRRQRAEMRRDRLRAGAVWVLAAPLDEGMWCGPFERRKAFHAAEMLGGVAIRPVYAAGDDADRLLDEIEDDEAVAVVELDQELAGLLTIDRIWRGVYRGELFSLAVFEGCPECDPPHLYRLLRSWLGHE